MPKSAPPSHPSHPSLPDNWEHLELRSTRPCIVLAPDGARLRAEGSTGVVTTGRSRVFMGYCVVIDVRLPSDLGQVSRQFVGRDPHCLADAAKHCAALLAEAGLQLRAAVLRPDYVESGLSSNSGWGYIRDQGNAVKRVWMLADKDVTDSAGGDDDKH